MIQRCYYLLVSNSSIMNFLNFKLSHDQPGDSTLVKVGLLLLTTTDRLLQQKPVAGSCWEYVSVVANELPLTNPQITWDLILRIKEFHPHRSSSSGHTPVAERVVTVRLSENVGAPRQPREKPSYCKSLQPLTATFARNQSVVILVQYYVQL